MTNPAIKQEIPAKIMLDDGRTMQVWLEIEISNVKLCRFPTRDYVARAIKDIGHVAQVSFDAPFILEIDTD